MLAAPSPSTEPRAPASSPPHWGAFLAVLVIVCAVLATYWSATAGEFLSWDDDINLTTNPHLSPLTAENLRWMATDTSLMRRYIPVAWLGWGLEQAAFGLNARVTHAVNVLFHAINAALVFLIAGKILRLRAATNRVAPATALIAAAGAALLWALHPLRVETVAWASGRLYLQATFFLLLATWTYLRSQTDQTSHPLRWIGLSVTLYALSLFTYPIALGFIAALLLIDLLVTGRLDWRKPLWADPTNRHTLRQKIPFVGAAMLALTATLWARATATGIWAATAEHNLDAAVLAQRVMRALYHWLHVLWKPLVPFGLSPVYTDLTEPNPLAAKYLLAAAGFTLVTGWLALRSRRSPVPFTLWLCHLVFLLPYVGLTEVAHYPNDRYTYVHAILVAIVAAILAARWLRPTVTALGAALLVGWAVLAARQTNLWRSDETLFRHAIASVGDDPYRGDLTWRLANTLQKKGRVEDARQLYEETLRIATGNTARAAAHQGLGILTLESGKPGEATEHFRQAAAFAPTTVLYLQWYSFALLREGRIQEAWPVIGRGLQLDPANPHLLQYERGARQLLGLPANAAR